VRKTPIVLGFVIGVYLVIRAVLEFFVIDFGDPATYEKDWGGPHLAGVLAVHVGGGVIAGVLMGWYLLRRRKTR
jgi:hypothetical protein